jgi:hypothetical protein
MRIGSSGFIRCKPSIAQRGTGKADSPGRTRDILGLVIGRPPSAIDDKSRG